MRWTLGANVRIMSDMKRNMPLPPWFASLVSFFPLLCLLLQGCKKEENQHGLYQRYQACKDLFDRSAAVALALKEGLNRFETQLLEEERGRGMEKCLRRYADIPSLCLDTSSPAALEQSLEVATAFCLTWPAELVACIRRQDQHSPACLRALEEFRRADDSAPREQGPKVEGQKRSSDSLAEEGSEQAR